jgi:Leucine-rich repeat (LRR) protein/tRNA A-37 threonylcarbamoyl transferase component Bud32
MAVQNACPAREEFARVLSGQTPPGAVESLATHIETCSDCQQTLRSLIVGEGSSGLQRDGQAPQADADRLALDGLIGRLLGMKGISTGSVSVRPGGETHSESDAASAEMPRRYPFLEAPVDRDELGRLGGHRVLRPLGEGGMGIVFEAEDLQLRRRVALKVMKPTLAKRPEARRRFLREARLAASLEHDHVVAVHLVGESGALPFLTMPLLKGESLETLLMRERVLPPSEVIRIASEVASALAAAHGRKIVHRDIKPSNVWLESGGGRVKVLDFGLARLTDGESILSDPQTVVGTPAYMAPEQVRGEPLDGRTDLFALGCLMYRMSVGRSPFLRSEMPATLLAVTSEDAPSPVSINPAVPAALSELVMKLLRKKPAERPATAEVVLDALREIGLTEHRRQSQPSIQSAPLPAQPLERSPSSSEGGRPQVGASARRIRPRTAIAVGALLLAGAALVCGITLIVKHKDGRVERIELQDGDSVEIAGAKPGDLKVAPIAAKVAEPTLSTPVQSDAAPVAPAPTLPPGQRGRKAAEWVLSLKGKVRVEVGNQLRWVTTIKDLPSGDFRLEAIDLQGIPVADAGLAHLEGLNNLTVLELKGAPITDEGLRHLEGLTGLKMLRLSFLKITDAGLVHLRGLKNLDFIDLWGSPMSGSGLVHLQALPRLEHLALSPAADGGLAAIRGIKSLKFLNFTSPAAGDACVADLEGMAGITGLWLNDAAQVTDAGLVHLRKLPNLTNLNVRGTRVTNAGLEEIVANRNLTYLSVSGLPTVKGSDLPRLHGLSKLRGLELNGLQLTDADLEHLSAFTELTDLWLIDNTAVTDAGMARLKKLQKLRDLDLTNTRVGDAGMADLNALVNMEYLFLTDTLVGDAGMAHLNALTKLHHLELCNTRVSDASIRCLVNYFPALNNLKLTGTRLSAKGCSILRAAFPAAAIEWSEPNRTAAEAVLSAGATVRVHSKGAAVRTVKTVAELPDEYFQVVGVGLGTVSLLPVNAFEKLAALRDPDFDGLSAVDCSGSALDVERLDALLRALPESIGELSLAHTRASDGQLAQLVKHFSRLRRLDLWGCPIVGRGLSALKSLSELRELDLGCPTLTDLFAVDLGNLVALKRLERLSLAGSGIGDDGLKQLTTLTTLKELDLTGTKVTEQGVAAFRQGLPACKIRTGKPNKG